MTNNKIIPPLLEVQNIQMYFPVYSGLFRKISGYVKAVDSVSFTLQQGEILGVVGESGCGKSTLGRTCLNLLKPNSGTILFEGQPIESINQNKLRQNTQIVFQDPYSSLNPRKTILENIGEALVYHKHVKTKKEKKEKVVEALEKVGLHHNICNHFPHEFSGGQQQRICIARAIVLKPKLIIFDEAVSALDVSVQAQVLNLLLDLKKELNLSYLFISHDLSVVRHTCDHIIVLYLGKVVESAPTELLFANPKHPYTQALLSAIPKEHPNENKKRITLKGEIPSPINTPSGCPFHTRCPFVKQICKEQFPTKKIDSNGHDYFCIL